ncbi:lipoprotein-releasing ABC transporter permease subunit [Pseudoalteromonas sp. T1lg10]|uniref:lipoprotein-releasing ABC transporter permease subunit n=1 Tax=Pseudoalteromonas sp. T1lg10 TaxID=2077093 RepID=UPI000CF73965|nr:lipoprotein-releasing ABC transporter permease subunit [Pseudoalteromonas sp. T1lg10]
MYKPVSLFIGLRYSRLSKGSAFVSFVSFFSIAGIALGITALFTVMSVMDGFENNLKRTMLSMIPHLQFTMAEREPEAQQELIADLKAQPQVSSIKRYHQAQAIVQSAADIQGVLLQAPYQSLPDNVVENIEVGSLKSLYNERYQIAISRYLARTLDVGVGDTLRVTIPSVTTYTPMGRIPAQRLFTVAVIYRTGSELDMHTLFTSGESLQRLLRIKNADDAPIEVSLSDAFNSELVLSRLNEQQRQGVTDWRQSQGSLFAAVAMEKRIMSLLLGLIFMVAVFNILSSLTMMVREKQGEVAILQTLGLDHSQIARIFMIQGLYNGVVGSVIGAVLAVLVVFNLNAILAAIGLHLFGQQELPVVVSYGNLMLIVLGAVVMSFVATLYPAKKAAEVRPAEVLRYE